jgi:predicted CXXCH cytochrome family protein
MMKTLFFSLLLCLCIPMVWAADASTSRLDIGKGGQCVEDPQWMRKNHMHLLKHGRDDALRRGIRDEKHSLKNCIECHASTKDDSVIAREDSFCVGCHKYEAVKVDCFECHSGTRKSAWLQRNKK